MDFTILSKDSIKIRTKKASFIVASSLLKQKLEADALLLTKTISDVDLDKGLIITGPGEYEIAGAKLSTLRSGTNILHVLRADNLIVCFGEAAAMNALKEKLDECHVLLIFTESLIDEATVTNLQPKTILCFGEKAAETAEVLMKDSATTGEEQKETSQKPVEKFSVTAEKLPSVVQVVLLG